MTILYMLSSLALREPQRGFRLLTIPSVKIDGTVGVERQSIPILRSNVIRLLLAPLSIYVFHAH